MSGKNENVFAKDKLYIMTHTSPISLFFIPRSFHCSCSFDCGMMRRSVNLLQVNDQQWSQLYLSLSSEFANPYRTLQALSGLCWILAVPSQNCTCAKDITTVSSTVSYVTWDISSAVALDALTSLWMPSAHLSHTSTHRCTNTNQVVLSLHKE